MKDFKFKYNINKQTIIPDNEVFEDIIGLLFITLVCELSKSENSNLLLAP